MNAKPRQNRAHGWLTAVAFAAVVSNCIADPLAAEDRRLLADGLMSRGLFERAAAEYDALLSDHPDIGERDVILFRWGDSLRQIKRTEEADAVFARLLDEFPSSTYVARAIFNRGAIALAAGRYDAAADFLGRIVDSEPSVRQDTLYYLGEAFARAGRDADAIPRFETYLSEFPEGEYAWFSKIALALALERRAGEAGGADAVRARDLLREAATAPDAAVAAEALFLLGQCDFTRGDYAASARSFAELRRRFPDSHYTSEAASRAAWASERSDNPAETLALAEAALRDPAVADRDEWLYLKGRALFQLDRDGENAHVEEATKTMEELVNTFDNTRFLVSAAFACAAGHARLGHTADALAMFAIIPRDDPIRPQVLRLAASCHETLGQKDKAIECYRELDRDFADDADAETSLFRLARLLQECSRWEEAAESWQRFADRFPKSERHASALYAEGACLKAANKLDAAFAAWDRLVERHPDDDLAVDSCYVAGVELFRLKRTDAALAKFDAYFAHGDKASAHRADAGFYRGCLLVQQERFADALAAFQAARAASPSPEIDAECRFQTWFVLQKLDRLDEAADELDALLGLPSVASRLQPAQIAWSAEHQYHRGRLDEARRAARYLADTASEDDWRQTAWAWLGRIEAARGDAAAAETAFRNAANITAQTRYAAEARLRLGEYRLAAKDIEAAERHFTKAIEQSQARDMVDVRVRATVGLAHAWLAQGRKEDAVRQLVAVCMISRDDVLIPPLIAEAVPLLRELGRDDEADVLLQDLRELYPESDAARALLPPPEPVVPVVPKVPLTSSLSPLPP